MTVDAHAHIGPQFGPDLLSRLVAAARRNGVDRMLISALGRDGFVERPSVDDLVSANDQVAAAIATDPLFAGVVYCSGEHARESLDLMERHIADGPFVGVKLWIARRATDPGSAAVFERAGELGVPVLQHAWWKTVGGFEGESTPADVAEAARRHPGTTIQMGHLTGSSERGIDDVAGCPNVVVDTSGSDAEAGLVEYAVRTLGPDRVVFGSDTPGRDLAVQLARVTAADLPSDITAAVLGGNAQRLYTRLGPSSVPLLPTWSAAPVVDVSAFLGPWPFRPVPGDSAADLRRVLSNVGVTRAYVSPAAALLQPTPGPANLWAAEQVADDPFFSLVPVVNPTQNWRQELDRWPGVRAVRILPGPHDFPLAAAQDLATECARRDLTLIVQLRVRDQRISHPRLVWDEPGVDEIGALHRASPTTRLIIAGANTPEIDQIVAQTDDHVWCELSHADGQDPIRTLLHTVDPSRLLMGSHAPGLVPTALAARLADAELPTEIRTVIASANAHAAGL